MSFRARFPVPNTAFPPPPPYNNNFVPSATNNNFACKPNDGYQSNVQSSFTNYNTNSPNINTNQHACIPPPYSTNKPNQELIPPTHFYNNSFSLGQQSGSNISLPFPNSVTTSSSNLQKPTTQPLNTYNQFHSNHSQKQTFSTNPTVNFQVNPNNLHFTNNQGNVLNQRLPYPNQNAPSFNLAPAVNFQGHESNVHHAITTVSVPTTFNTLPPSFSVPNLNPCNAMTSTVNNSVHTSAIINNQASAPVSNNVPLIVPPAVPTLPPVLLPPNNSYLNVPPPTLGNNSMFTNAPNKTLNPLSEKESKLTDFLAKFSTTDKRSENKISVPEFRSALKDAFFLIKLLSEKKSKMKNLMEANESEWSSEMQSINHLKKQVSEMCSVICLPDHLNSISNKLKCIKRKRAQKKKTKLNKLSEKIKAEQNRQELHQEIDKWLDDIKEKNLKLKREVEMKKEADFILLEVRRKIQEANRTIEKIKVFEKLRNARLANAVQKGLRILPEHNENFEKKISTLKETMLKQLADYEAEEKALKVMLETEQEGQLEEKIQWELKKVKTLQQKRQSHIMQCLFGNSEDPLPTDPLYLFHKYQTSANNSIENLIQIRHQWDMHISEDGESIPQQWVVPVAPSNSSWEECVTTSKS